jgi:hypothetical protein
VERDGVLMSTGLGAGRAGAPGIAGSLGAYPARDVDGHVVLLAGERRLGTWRAHTATVTRRAPGGWRPVAQRPWRGAHAPRVLLTDRRVLLYGGLEDEAVQVVLERLMRGRADLRRRHGSLVLETMLHRRDAAAAGILELRIEFSPRAAAALVEEIAAAHRARWAECELPGPVADAVAATRPQRAGRTVRYDAAVHMPLGLEDAIRGPGAVAGVPQRVRLPLA